MRLVKLDGVQGRGMWAWAWGTGVSWYLRRFRILWHGAVAEALSIGELQAVGCASTVFHFDMCVTLGYCSISTLIFFFFFMSMLVHGLPVHILAVFLPCGKRPFSLPPSRTSSTACETCGTTPV